MNNEVKDKIKLLGMAYAKQLPNKVQEIETRWQEVKKSDNQEELKKLIRNAHTLCGTGGTYGYRLISVVARQLERYLNRIKTQSASLKMKKEIENLIRDLKQLAHNPPEIEMESLLTAIPSPNNQVRLIYILTNNKTEYEQIQQFNYAIQIYDEAQDFLLAIHSARPDMVIIEEDYIESIPAENFKKIRDEFILLVYASSKDELFTRLRAIRHGGQAFVHKPFEISDLLRTIDNLFEAKRMFNERILIVDDSDFLADYYSMILEDSGLICEVVTDPKNFLSVLQEFQPDLILMDINMPYCSGSELAQIVNQQENLSGVPIIYLSTISEKSKQLELMSYAGDDFLTKPINPKHFLASIRNRLMRSRMIRSRMMRDSLTNLYNHTMIHHQLEREILMAERNGTEVQVVLLDIDHFKLVNDTYGHQAGDNILKELSVFLQTNLRKSDLIGRYGGEEFLIILPNMDGNQALQMINNLRIQFSKKPYSIENKSLFVTISGGIAGYPPVDNLSKLIKAADEALYQAKEQGRNRIVLAK